MAFTIQMGPHSSEKDHTIMTGGTLKIDKEVTSDAPLTVYTYTLDFFPSSSDSLEFHKGMHTNEHLLAYSKDTGSVRASLSEVDPSFDGKWILDVSPYQLDSGSFGFRLTSLKQINIALLQEAVKKSIALALAYLKKVSEGHGDKEGYMGIPFATEGQCGQYSFHSPGEARKSLESIDTSDIKIEETKYSSEDKKAVVCDLRLLKPKLVGKDDMVLFDPKVSYILSKEIEKELPQKLAGSIVIVGTFGCMTGMYLCVSCRTGDTIELSEIHGKIIDIIRNVDISSFDESEKRQVQTVLENYEKHGK